MRLRLRTSNGLVSVQVDDDADMDDLESAVRVALQYPDIRHFTLLPVGVFPPKPIDFSSDILVSEVLRDNDALIVQDTVLSGQQASASGPIKKSRKPKKRANDMVPGQSNIINSIASSSSNSSPSTKKKSLVNTTNPRIATLSTISSNRRPGAGNRRSSTNRLSVRAPSEPVDLGQQLMSAVSGEGGALNQLLRNDFTRAVQFRYEEAAALARLTAAYNGLFAITPVDPYHSISTSSSSRRAATFKAKVVYSRGAGHRVQAEEVVEIIPEALVVQVLREAVADVTGHGREILIPRNLARQSPRIFWSLIHARGADFPAILAQIFPDIHDWSWLMDRPRELSAKAAENNRQNEEQQALKRMRAAKRQKPSGQHPAAEDHDITATSSMMTASNDAHVISSTSSSANGDEKDAASHVLANAISSQTFSSIVHVDFLSALISVLGDDTMGSLADADYDASMMGRLIAANPQRRAPSMDQLEVWVANAQQAVITAIWSECICVHDENLRRSLAAVGVVDPASFLSSASIALASLQVKLSTSNPKFNAIRINGRSGLELLQWIARLCGLVEQQHSWILEYHAGDGDVGEEFYSGEAVDNMDAFYGDLAGEGWMLEASSGYHIGTDAKIWADDEEQYMLRGRIIAYLPPSDEEPMALWKMMVDAHEIIKNEQETSSTSSSSSRRCWFEDLEEDEVEAAIKRAQDGESI